MRSRLLSIAAVLTLFGLTSTAWAKQPFKAPTPRFTSAVAFDVSKPVRGLAPLSGLAAQAESQGYLLKEVRAEHELAEVADKGFTGDGALQTGGANLSSPAPAIANPNVTFEGLSNQDNFNIYNFRVAPPDPVGAVGPNHYVEMVNLTFAVYDKAGTMLAGPSAIGDLWAGFAINDCTGASGDPVVLYDRQADRWILSQFTTSGLNANGSYNGTPFYNCVAISQTSDPTGAYYRYAFVTTEPNGTLFFPDYPKYGVWNDSYLLTSRDFGPTVEYGISVYALEKTKMLVGDPTARSVKFFLDSDLIPLHLMGDGLLPADIDGRVPDNNGNNANHAAPIVGTMDSGYVYGAPFDGINIFELMVRWNKVPDATLDLVAQLPVADFDSVFPCVGSRSCIPEPGVANNRWLDALTVRQRPTYRLAFRDFGDYQTMVTNQSVEARGGGLGVSKAGVRWYEIRRKNGVYSLFQQGTYAPDDGVNRWMGSIAMDKKGNVALGYSVSNGTAVFPGMRYTGRLAGDPAGQMTLGEGTIINGTGAQVTVNNRWGDYSSMNVDPTDDCTFWYVNEYYQTTGVIGINTVPWQTRVGSFKLPGCN